MKRKLLIYLAAIALASPSISRASFLDQARFLPRRQSGTETEQEVTTTPKSPTESSQQQPPSTTANGSPTEGRLYPDLPGQTAGSPNFLPPFNAHPRHGSMPPFVPFGMQVGSRLNADQQPGPFGTRMLPPPRPMSPAERLQSQSFTSGLGQRLLSMIGIDTSQQNQTADGMNDNRRSDNPQMLALQNSTVLNELNKRVSMVMGSLSKMYNSTVQEQLELLNERFKKEAENSTNPWQQRVAQQVPMFFKQMAGRVSEAQEQLNRVWRDVVQVAQGNNSVFERANQAGGANGQPMPFFNAIERFMNPSGDRHLFGQNEGGGGDFVNQISRSFGMQTDQQTGGATNDSQRADLGARLREFWHVQVQPQIGMVRGQMARAWRDLTTSGALTPDSMARSRFHHNGNNTNTNNDLVDSLLKEADTEAAEFALVTPTSDSSSPSPDGANNQNQQPSKGMPKLSPQMQNRLAMMQRDLNQLWQGLSSSLQNAVNNVRTTLNPRQRQMPGFAPMSPNQNAPQEVDQAQNEINTKVQNLAKLQREADVVYDTVQQQQRDAQQRQTFADRFRGFINNVDLSGLNQLPDRIGDQVNRFGTAIGNFWNTIPDRWDNMMTHRQNQENQARMKAQMDSRISSTPASTAENSVMNGS